MESFDSIRERYEHVYLQTGRLFEQQCRLAEDALAASFSAYFELSRKGGMDERSEYLAAFFYRNCVYLSATYQLIRSGMVDPAGNNMRTIFETIIWQYAYLLDEGIYDNFRAMAELDREKLRSMRDGGWSNTKERRLENLRRKYSFQKMMKKLYSKGLYEKFFFNQYWALCQKSHSSIVGVNYNTPNMQGSTTLEKRPAEIKENLSAALYLTAENLICFLNCFSGRLGQDRIDGLLERVNAINRGIPPALGLSPDTKKLEFTLRFREV
jgi:hypothetical protein